MKSTKNILVLTYWSFSDALIQTYTLPYLKQIAEVLSEESKIYLVTLEKNNSSGIIELEGSNLINIQYPYSAFGLAASLSWLKNIFSLKNIIKKNNIDVIHAFCTPAGMIGYILSRLSHRPLILDSYEPHSEAMVENGEWTKNSLSFKLLFYFEKKQSQRATTIIGTTPGMKDYALRKYNVAVKDFYFKPACVDLEIFKPDVKKNTQLINELQLNNKIVCVYAGKFGGIYLKNEVFEFYKACYQKWNDNFVALILTSHPEEEINNLITLYNLPKTIFRIIFVQHAQIHKYIGLGDFAITPVKPVPTKKYCTPIKNGEYWALGLPIVITKNISVDSNIIDTNNTGFVLKELNMAEYQKAVEKISALLSDNTLTLKIRQIAERERNYSISKTIYRTIYS